MAFAVWRVIGCFISFFLLINKDLAQEGFVSLRCCANSNISDPETGIDWTPDNPYLLPNIGKCKTVDPPVLHDTSYKRVRVFGTSFGNRWCYNLTTIPTQFSLIRATFLHGPVLQTSPNPLFNVSIGPTIVAQVNASVDALEVETIFQPTSSYVNFCLLRGNGNAYLSNLELRPLNGSIYSSEVDSSVILKLVTRVDVGNPNTTIRFPLDQFDRIWSKDETPGGVGFISSNTSVLGIRSPIPTEVLQTAVTDSMQLHFLLKSLDMGSNVYLVCLYFLELNSSIKAGQRIFDIFANGERIHKNFDILENGTNYREVLFQVHANSFLNISLFSVSDEFGPICNAYEVYQMQPRIPGTAQQDVDILVQMRDQFLMSNENDSTLGRWTGDPCLPLSPIGQPVPWEGLGCEPRKEHFVITKLDLSSNSLEGLLPPIISGLSELKELNLSSNQLIGTMMEFPVSSMITSIDLRNNNFMGVVPESFAVLPHLRSLLIGCNPQLNTTLPEGLLNRSNFTTDFGNCDGQNNMRMLPQRSTVFISSIACGSVLLTFAVGVILSFFYKHRHRPDGGGQMMSKNAVFSLPIMESEELKPITIQSFSLQFIETVTNKYKTTIGEGGFGAVYRGTLTDGQEVAVKVRSATSTQGTREFENELNLLSTIRHENLVPLLGYCCENDQQILVYSFMSNGSLQDRLYGEAAKIRKPLDWQTRLSISLGAARGLMYLHTFAGRCVIHRDVKSSNILLDHSMCAKVADFGFSKYAPQEGDSGASLEVRGTAGYLDPEYYSTQHLSVKSDVFSFGVVLLEIISGREPLNIHRPRNEWSLVEWAKPFIKESRIEEVVDPTIKTGYTAEAMWRVVETALACIEPFSVYRPCMADIVRELEDALIIENNASEYMRSIESFGGSCRFSVDRKSLATIPTDPSPIFSKAMATPR